MLRISLHTEVNFERVENVSPLTHQNIHTLLRDFADELPPKCLWSLSVLRAGKAFPRPSWCPMPPRCVPTIQRVNTAATTTPYENKAYQGKVSVVRTTQGDIDITSQKSKFNLESFNIIVNNWSKQRKKLENSRWRLSESLTSSTQRRKVRPFGYVSSPNR